MRFMKYTIIVENIKAPLIHSDDDIFEGANKYLRKNNIKRQIYQMTVRKKSIDARDKDSIHLVCSVAGIIELNEKEAVKKTPSFVKLYPIKEEKIVYGSKPMTERPVIVGFGPAGMFCALELARYGYAPIVFERGAGIDERIKAVDLFMNGGEFSPTTNIQFGAGGAGTFSDGKLTTRIGDPLCKSVLDTFCDFGASSDIKWQAKPHIGTDVLQDIVRRIHDEIIKHGGEILYNHRVSDITDNKLRANGEEHPFGALVLAIGHSARDTYSEIISKSFPVVAKPFSVGVRIEHLCEDINFAMYGDAAEVLPPAEYSLSHRDGNRGVYSFCMCPGGVVVPAASEEHGVVTNGMSYSRRDGVNSNSALAVSVLPEDFGNSPNGAIEFQRQLERKAYHAGDSNYSAPAQTVGNFLNSSINAVGKIKPTYMNGNVQFCDLTDILPDFVSDMLKCGIAKFGRQIKGFDCLDAILTGVETRTSAPVRILRGDNRKLADADFNIYPCGEGAGYAGGIMSAAVDGIKTARAIMAEFAPYNK